MDEAKYGETIDALIDEVSWLEWQCLAVGRRDFWRIQGALGSEQARMNEGAD